MIVNFRTNGGAVFCIDHDKKEFVQLHPTPRSGPLWNQPTVRIGKRVTIMTAPPDNHPNAVARCIETGIVAERSVIL